MEIYEARVDYHRDFTKSGKFWATLIDGPPGSVEVTYTSPYFDKHITGVFSPPCQNSRILITKLGEYYYYLSTIVDHDFNYGISPKDYNGSPLPLNSEKNAYNTSGQPTVMTFKNSEGAGLKMTRLYEINKDIVNDTRLESTQGHKLVLSDSPNMDCVVLSNKDGDGITISGRKSTPFSARSIEIKSDNSHTCTVQMGEYYVRVVDGRDVTIRNDSIGTFGFLPTPSNMSPTNPGINPLLQFGNINLVSKWRDINIYTDTPTIVPWTRSNIFISTTKGFVQINSMGDVSIFSNLGSVSIQSAGDLNLMSLSGNVNIESKVGSINLKTNNPTIGLGDINVDAGAVLNAQGLLGTNLGSGVSELHLNKPKEDPDNLVLVLPGAPSIPTLNVYGR